MESNPQNSGKDEVRKYLANAAWQIFVCYGYKKTALDDIARDA